MMMKERRTMSKTTASEPKLDKIETHLAGTLKRVRAAPRLCPATARLHSLSAGRGDRHPTPRLEKVVHRFCQCRFGDVDHYHHCPCLVSFVWKKKCLVKTSEALETSEVFIYRFTNSAHSILASAIKSISIGNLNSSSTREVKCTAICRRSSGSDASSTNLFSKS